MSDNVEISMSSNDAAVLRSLQAVERGFAKLTDRLSDVEQQSKKSTKSMEEGFGGIGHSIAEAGKELLAMGAGLLSIEKLAEGLMKTLEDLDRRREKAAATQVDYGRSLKQTVFAAGGFMGSAEVDELSKRTAENTGSDANKVNAALKSAFEAAGVKNKGQAGEVAKTAEAVLKIYKDQDADTIGKIAGEAARIQQLGGPGTTAEGAVGMLQRIAREAGLEGPEALARKGIPSIAQGVKSGMTVGEAGATFASLAHGLEDPSGKLASGAFSELVGQLRHHFPEVDPAKIIERMQAGDKALLKKFRHKAWVGGAEVPGAHFSENTELAINALLEGRDKSGAPSGEAERFVRLKNELGDFREGAKFFSQMAEDLGKVGAIGKGERKEIFESAAQQLELGDTKGASSAINKEGLEKNLAAAGAGYGERTAAAWKFRLRTVLGEDANRVTEEILAQKADDLTREFDYVSAGTGGFGQRIPHHATAEETEAAAKLRGAVRRLQGNSKEESSGAAERETMRMGTGEPGTPQETRAEEAAEQAAEQAVEMFRERRAAFAARGVPYRSRWSSDKPGVAEAVDSYGNVLGERMMPKGSSLPEPSQILSADISPTLRHIDKGIAKLVELAQKPTKVVGVGIRPEVTTTSTAGQFIGR
jgi:hypothetical protein